jgi:hypothetical protein
MLMGHKKCFTLFVSVNHFPPLLHHHTPSFPLSLSLRQKSPLSATTIGNHHLTLFSLPSANGSHYCLCLAIAANFTTPPPSTTGDHCHHATTGLPLLSNLLSPLSTTGDHRLSLLSLSLSSTPPVFMFIVICGWPISWIIRC